MFFLIVGTLSSQWMEPGRRQGRPCRWEPSSLTLLMTIKSKEWVSQCISSRRTTEQTIWFFDHSVKFDFGNIVRFTVVWRIVLPPIHYTLSLSYRLRVSTYKSPTDVICFHFSLAHVHQLEMILGSFGSWRRISEGSNEVCHGRIATL